MYDWSFIDLSCLRPPAVPANAIDPSFAAAPTNGEPVTSSAAHLAVFPTADLPTAPIAAFPTPPNVFAKGRLPFIGTNNVAASLIISSYDSSPELLGSRYLPVNGLVTFSRIS